MLLSILIGGKNDNYAADSNGRGGVCKRLELTLNKMIDNLRRLGKDDIEVIVCDWGSDSKISDSLVKERHPNIKFVYVSPDIAKKYNGRASYSIVHPYNVSFRHSKGEYVIFWDSDCFMPYEEIENLYNFAKGLSDRKEKKFYQGSRFHIPRSGYVDALSYKDVDEFLKTCVVDTKTTLRPTNDADNFVNDHLLRHNKVNVDAFQGTAMATLLHRDIAEDSTCWWEELSYWGWQDVEFHIRLNRKYICGGDMEDFGIKFFHLYHYEPFEGKEQPIMNEYLMPQKFNANHKDWGLVNETLEIIS